jgi:hypothetical protein
MIFFSQILYPGNCYYSDCLNIIKVRLGYVSCINNWGFQEAIVDVVKRDENCSINITKYLKAYTKSIIEVQVMKQDNLLTTYEQQIQRMEKIAVIRSNIKAKQRIFNFLIWAEKNKLLDLTNHNIIAEILLLNRETVTRTLSSLKKQNIINYSQKITRNHYSIIIVNRKYLESSGKD